MPSQSLRQSLQQKQALKLSPQQVQLMRLVQVPTFELEQRIKEELQNNPALEEGEGGIFGDEVSLSRLREDAPEERHGNDDDSDSDAHLDSGADGASNTDVGSDSGSASDEDFNVNDYLDPDRDGSSELGGSTSDEDFNVNDYLDPDRDGSSELGGSTSDEDFNVNDYLDPDRDDYAYKRKSDNYRASDDDYEPPVRFRQGLQEQLKDELGMLNLDEKQRQIGEVIIGNLDADGYLQRSVPAIVNDLAFSLNLIATEDEVQEVLNRIQTLEPSGIGARDLRECLLIQVRNLLHEDTGGELGLGEMYVLQTAEALLSRCFDEFARRQYPRIAEKLKVSEEDVRDAVDLIKTLDPKPGGGGAETIGAAAPIVIPDFYLTNDHGQLTLTLNSKNDPNLRISPSYEYMLREYADSTSAASSAASSPASSPASPAASAATSPGSAPAASPTSPAGTPAASPTSPTTPATSPTTPASDPKRRRTRDAALFVKQKIDAARWFMEMIQQRRTTMMRVMQAIVDFQHDCFAEGDEKLLKPMRLRDIAQIVGMDVSTVSRVINNKYVQGPYGTFLVKKLFSQGLENEEGEEISTTQIKLALQDLIDAEDKSNPYTDEMLVDLLKERGFHVARRTVAKYREGRGIPVARLRKEY